MSDNSSATDSDNGLIPQSNSLSITSCTVGTQTPQLQRRQIEAEEQRQQQTKECNPISNGSASQASSVVILRVDNQNGLTGLENEAKTISIPDVVVEYIKDSYSLVGKENGHYDVECGTDNPAFDGHEMMIRTSSKSSLRDGTCDSSDTDETNFSTTEGHLDAGMLTVGGEDRRMYRSMPKDFQKKRNLDELKVHSQPSTPQLHRMRIGSRKGSASSILYIDDEPMFTIPPSPTFGFRPLESETSAVYTIIKTFITPDGTQEIHLLPTIAAEEETDVRLKLKRKFEYVPAPPAKEKKRQRLQCCTDILSLLFFLPGLFLAIFTPVLIVPMVILPQEYFLEFLGLFVLSGTAGVVFMSISGFFGNLVWHYDDRKNRLRLKMHCGTGPLRHFWGNSFFKNSNSTPINVDAKKPMVI